MNEEEINLMEKFKRLGPGSRRIALAQITAAAERQEQVQRCGLVSGTVPAHTPGGEGLPGAGVRA